MINRVFPKANKKVGNGGLIDQIGKKMMVQSVPCELNLDHLSILALAQLR